MSSAHPPPEHNPHVWQDVLITRRDLPPVDEAPTGAAVEPGTVTDAPTVQPADNAGSETEGGEQPSPPQETADPAGTDSSDSSSPDETSAESSESEIPSPVPSAENRSGRAARKGSSTARGGTGTGTAR